MTTHPEAIAVVTDVCRAWKPSNGTVYRVDPSSEWGLDTAVVTVCGPEISNRDVSVLRNRLTTDKTSVQSAVYTIKGRDTPCDAGATCRITVRVTLEKPPGAPVSMLAALAAQNTRKRGAEGDLDLTEPPRIAPAGNRSVSSALVVSERKDPPALVVSEKESVTYDGWFVPVRMKPLVAYFLSTFQTRIERSHVGKGPFKGVLLTRSCVSEEEGLPKVIILMTGPGELCAERLAEAEECLCGALKGSGLVTTPLVVAVNSVGFTLKHRFAN